MSEEERQQSEAQGDAPEKKEALLDILTRWATPRTLGAEDISANTVQYRVPSAQVVSGSISRIRITQDPDGTDSIRIGDDDIPPRGPDRLSVMKFDVKGDNDPIALYPPTSQGQ